MDHFFTSTDLAILLGVRRETISHWTSRGWIPRPVRMHGRNRHDLIAVMDAVREHGLKVNLAGVRKMTSAPSVVAEEFKQGVLADLRAAGRPRN